jgi:Protein of unknown function (DUF998)
MKKFLLLCGIGAPVMYVFAVLLGGLLRPDYSPVAKSISSLVATGAPNKGLLDPLFALYNLSTVAFGIGLWQRVREDPTNRRERVGLVAALVLILEGVIGLVTLLFPEPAEGSPINSTGAMHIILAGLSSVTTMLTILLLGFWFRANRTLRGFGTYSFLSVLVVLISGGFAAASIAANSPIGGLVERITIGGFMQWLLVVAIKLYRGETIAPEKPFPKAFPAH